ncbi:MAG: hypothetical protein IJX90_09355 [Blautia sp.]|nr:hypothetical protein [Blautia sp.]
MKTITVTDLNNLALAALGRSMCCAETSPAPNTAEAAFLRELSARAASRSVLFYHPQASKAILGHTA